MSAKLDAYYAVVASELGRNPGNLRFQNETVFGDVPFAGRSLLDVGAGAGLVASYAACLGATRVVALEPEAAGSHPGAVRERFERIRDQLELDQVELRAETLQEFDPAGETFDVIASIASINHLDEEACMRLHEDPQARATYIELLAKLARASKRGGTLIVVDAARRNLFGDLGLRHPIARSIEWKKHQSPKLWAGLLEEVGFTDPRISWHAFNTLRRPGRLLLGNRPASYVLTSGFLLKMTRA